MSTDARFRATIVGTGLVLPSGTPALVTAPKGVPLGEGYAYVRSAPFQLGAIPPGMARRLGRSQKMMIDAAGQAVSGSMSAARVADAAVAVGTGLGSLEETVEFLENMVRLDEREPKPARFVNAVNNSPAASVAVAFGFTGENRTVVQESISFEMTLWHAMQVLRAGRAPFVLVGGVDEVNAYVVAIGRARGLWQTGGAPLTPLGNPAADGTLPGEGAAALLLAADSGGAAGLPSIAYTRTRPLARPGTAHVNTAAEADFIRRGIEAAGLAPGDVDMVLLGANGDRALDALYENVAGAIAPALGSEACFATYKGSCGEFYSSGAIGAVLAARAVAAGIPQAEIAMVLGTRACRRISTVLVYSLTQYTYHSVSVVTL
jgi:3-oxoacyl-(acyl-carrier-protein) synthase